MKFVIYNSSTARRPRVTSNQKLISFRKGIKREETAYPTLKDERYFDSFSRSLYITAKSHVYEHAQEELPPTIDEEGFQECQEFNTDQDLEPPTDDILDFITSQDHSDDQLDQVLQTYQADQKSQSETETPPRQMNAHITYHVAQAQQSKHGSLVDRGANGGLAGSDVRILSTSSTKCAGTGIDNHEIPGLDLVQCAALVQTNHGIVNLIMNEYAYYG